MLNWDDINQDWNSLGGVWSDVLISHNNCIIWDNINTDWNDVDYLWDDVSILVEIEEDIRKSSNLRRGGGNYSDYFRDNPWDKIRSVVGDEKTERVIKLYVKYKNKEYNKSIRKKEYRVNPIVENISFYNKDINIKVTASDIEIFMKDVIRESISIKVNL